MKKLWAFILVSTLSTLACMESKKIPIKGRGLKGHGPIKASEPLKIKVSAVSSLQLDKSLREIVHETDRTHAYASDISLLRQVGRVYREAWSITSNGKSSADKNIFAIGANMLSEVAEKSEVFPLSILEINEQENGKKEIVFKYNSEFTKYVDLTAIQTKEFAPKCIVEQDNDLNLLSADCVDLGQSLNVKDQEDMLFTKLSFQLSDETYLEFAGIILTVPNSKTSMEIRERKIEKVKFSYDKDHVRPKKNVENLKVEVKEIEDKDNE